MGCPFTIIPYILSFALLIVLWASELFAFHIPCESKAMRASAWLLIANNLQFFPMTNFNTERSKNKFHMELGEYMTVQGIR